MSSCNGIRGNNPLKYSIFVIDEGVARPPLSSPRIIPWIHNLDANSRHAWPVLERSWYFTDYEYLHFVSRYLDLFFLFLFIIQNLVSLSSFGKKRKNEVDGWVDRRFTFFFSPRKFLPHARFIHMLIDKERRMIMIFKMGRERKKDN